MKTKLILSLFLSILFLQINAQDNRTQIEYHLGILDNYVVELSFETKLAEGTCDCSVGSRKKNNDCVLYKVKVHKFLAWVDSSRYSKDDLLNVSQILIEKKLLNEVRAGEILTVTLGNTSTKEYLQLRTVLPTVLNKEYRFLNGHAHAVGIECQKPGKTFTKK